MAQTKLGSLTCKALQIFEIRIVAVIYEGLLAALVGTVPCIAQKFKW